eukprot:TRINITY_DN6312_c1_g2_i1.p1 TRINITY_DN6312_c1_g2~~TRINITY_DN6312_c1_g2_i1.p1  ORF type:complete len:366 (+),score=123.23 TRINITY_DN6312_c1_g2_i1:100-1197(+)
MADPMESTVAVGEEPPQVLPHGVAVDGSDAPGGEAAAAPTAAEAAVEMDAVDVVKIIPDDTATFSHVITTKQLSRPAQLMRLSELNASDHTIHYTVMAGVITQWVLACLGRKWADYCPDGHAVKWFYRVVVGSFVLTGFVLALVMVAMSEDVGEACCVQKEDGFQSCDDANADNSSIMDMCGLGDIDFVTEDVSGLFSVQAYEFYCEGGTAAAVFNWFKRQGIQEDYALIARLLFGVFDWPLTMYDLFAPKHRTRPGAPMMALFKFCALIAVITINKERMQEDLVTGCNYFDERFRVENPTRYQECLDWAATCGSNVAWYHDYTNRTPYIVSAKASLVLLLLECVLQGISYVGRMEWVRGIGLVV